MMVKEDPIELEKKE